MAIMKSLTIGNFTGEIPSKTSDLTNDSGFVDAAGAAAAAPVQSVNGKTGSVVLDAADVGALTEAALIALLPVDTASGPIASFPDGARNAPLEGLTIGIQPVQDLHGYANPWPAGGGKNLLPPTLVSGTSVTEKDVTMTIDGQRFKFTGTASGNGGRFGLRTALFTLKAGTYYMSQETSGTLPVPIVHDSTNNIIKQGVGSFTLAGDTSVFVGFNVTSGTAYNSSIGIQIESGSTATSFAPYSNLCPITGWSEAKVTRTGKNLYHGTNRNGQVGSTGTFSPVNNRICNVLSGSDPANSDQLAKAGTYTLSISGLDYCSVMTKDASGNIIDNFATAWHELPYAFTLTRDANIIFTARKSDNSNLDPNDYSPQIEVGSTATAYESPSIQTVTISLSGTRYGGTLDVLTGVLTVTHGYVSSLGDLDWSAFSTITAGKSRFVASISGGAVPTPASDMPDVLCSAFRANTGNALYSCEDGITINTQGVQVVVYDETHAAGTADAFADSVSGVQFVYPLATPLSVQLDANTLATLLGTNNVYSDTGDTSVTYRANIQKYIQKLVGA